MKELAIQLLLYLVEAILGVVVYFASKWLHNKCEQLKNNVQSEKVKSLISRFDYIVRVCVEATNQTFVESLKKENGFDADKQKEAFKKTFESIVTLLSDEDKEQIADEFGDLSAFITASIETYIKDSKDI